MFSEDLSFGKQTENKVSEFFSQFFTVKQSEGYDKDKDMILSGSIEVKHDRLALKTGNYAIELKDKGQWSGLATSKATSWVLCSDEGCWIVGTELLKKWVKDYGTIKGALKLTKMGESAEGVLVDYNFIRNFWKIL